MSRRLTLRVLVIVAALLLLPSEGAVAQTSRCPQAQAQYPPGRGALEVSRSEVQPGETITVRGCGFRPSSSVNIDLLPGPVRLGSTTADVSGGIETTVTIPASTSAGRHTLEASGVDPAGAARVLSASITVVGADEESRAAGADLPSTGSSSSAPLTAAGVGLVLLGSIAVYAARRRRAQRVTA